MVDPGKEFFGNVTTLMNKHKVNFQRSEAGNHRAQAFVERANRTLGEKIFSHQYSQEMADTEKGGSRSREWVEGLPAVLKVMNNEVSRLTGKEPTKVLKSADVPINETNYGRPGGLDEVKLPPGVKVRYLYSPGGKAVKGVVQLIRYGDWRFTIYHVVLFLLNNPFYIIEWWAKTVIR